MRVQVLVRLKPAVLDVQGKAVENTLRAQGYKGLSKVRVGRLVEFELESKTQEEAQAVTRELSEKLLANTTIENYEVKILS